MRVFGFLARQSEVSAYSTDERVKIYDVRYSSEGTNVFVPRNERLMRECERLLDKVGIRRAPWKRPPVTVPGPSLILSFGVAKLFVAITGFYGHKGQS